MRTFPCLLLAAFLALAGAATGQHCEPTDTPVWAGQTMRAGEGLISNSTTHLRFEVHTLGNWRIAAAHIYAGTSPVPTNGGGNVSPGQFPYKTDYDPPVRRHVEMVPFGDLGVVCGDTVWIAGHFDLVELDASGRVVRQETGWAHGKIPFTGGQWGWQDNLVLCCLGAGCGGSAPLALVEPTFVRGQATLLEANGAAAGDTVHFLWNQGRISCGGGVRVAGARLDLAAPVHLAGSATADSAGRAMLSLVLPATAPETWLGVQALVLPVGGPALLRSNPVAAPILP